MQSGRPNGFGKMYHKSGSVFIGQFKNGKAEGRGHFVETDGSYYQGKLRNNMANDTEGYYWTPNFEYRGGFVDNEIEGEGVEKSENSVFEGVYHKGKKTQGILRWNEDRHYFEYEGAFNTEGNFEGKGTHTAM
jgi:hypothetical protein